MVWRCDICGKKHNSKKEAEKCEKNCLEKDKIKLRENKKYRCDFCRNVYSTKKGAEECEERCSEKQEIEPVEEKEVLEKESLKEETEEENTFLGYSFENLFEKERFCFENEESLVEKIDSEDLEVRKYLGIFRNKKEKLKEEIFELSNRHRAWLRKIGQKHLDLYEKLVEKYGDEIWEYKEKLLNLVENKIKKDLTDLERNELYQIFIEESLIEHYSKLINKKMSKDELAEVFVLCNRGIHHETEDYLEGGLRPFIKSLEKLNTSDLSEDELKSKIIAFSKKLDASEFEEKLNDEKTIDWNKIESLTGLEFEKELAKLLKRKGYEVETTKGSGDQGADLILTDDLGQKIAVQAKKWIGAVGNSAVQQVVASKKYYDCEKAWVISTSDGFTKSAIELAKKNRVKLIGKKELREFL